MWPSWSVSGQDAAHGQAELPGAGQPGAPVPLVGGRGHQVPQPARIELLKEAPVDFTVPGEGSYSLLKVSTKRGLKIQGVFLAAKAAQQVVMYVSPSVRLSVRSLEKCKVRPSKAKEGYIRLRKA